VILAPILASVSAYSFPGAVKTNPINAMTLITDNKPIQELIEEKAVLLHEKLLRIP
jgi:hypothetical protein